MARVRAICGRSLGLGFYNVKNQLFIADAYTGLHVVGPNGRLATKIADSADAPFKFLNALYVDQLTGNVYFLVLFSISGIIFLTLMFDMDILLKIHNFLEI